MGLKLLFSWILLLFIGGCATVPKGMPTSGATGSLQELCQKYNIDCHWDGVRQVVETQYDGKKIRAMAGSNVVIVSGQKVILSGPLLYRQGRVIIPADFEAVVMGVRASAQTEAQKIFGSRLVRKVVIDAGHGGKDPGAIGYQGVKEKDIVLDIARRVGKNLKLAGIEVSFTRDSDEFITLQQRTEIASQPGIDLFVSIHANAHKSRRSNGVEVYYAAFLNLEDRIEGQRRANEKKLVGKFNMTDPTGDVKDIVSDMLYAHKMSVSSGLSDALARDLCQGVRGAERGSKPGRFFVLRNTLVPAVLIEVGFLTNLKESQMLQMPSYREKLAEEIVKTVSRFSYEARM